MNFLQEAFETSERRACRVTKQNRSTQCYRRTKPEMDGPLVKAIRKIAMTEPRAGYRTVTKLLVRAGWQVNLKRVHRLWKQEGLKVPVKPRKKRARGSSAGSSQLLQAESVDHVWSYDFVFDQTDDGGRLKWLPILDEYSRDLMSLEVARTMTALDVIEQLDELVSRRGTPQFIRSDNGPEFVAKAVTRWIEERGHANTALPSKGGATEATLVESGEDFDSIFLRVMSAPRPVGFDDGSRDLFRFVR